MFKLKNDYSSVIESSKWAVVKFSAPWCNTCRALAPVFDALQNTFEDVDFYEIDLDDLSTIPFANSLDVKSLPTVVMFHYGEVLWRVGKLTESEYSKNISEGMYYAE